jgi:putative cell wall-binding protein
MPDLNDQEDFVRVMRARTHHRRWIAIGATVGLALPLLVLMQWPGSATASFTVSRFAGADRYDTAKQVAEAAYPGGSATVLLASGLNFPDALAAAYLAGNENVPILLTDPNTASASALAAMSDLKTKNVTILGGSDAVSTIVEQTLDGTASTSSQGGNLVVTRIAGVDRYDTAAKIATTGGAADSRRRSSAPASTSPTRSPGGPQRSPSTCRCC